MYLLVCTDDSDEAISIMVGIVKLDTEFLVGLFEKCDFVV